MKIDTLELTIRRHRFFVITFILIVFCSYLGWFWFFNEQTLSAKIENWGAFGDFIGGLLNPLIAFLAFYWLTVSVKVQAVELSKTTDALVEASQAQAQQADLSIKLAQLEYLKMQHISINRQLSIACEELSNLHERARNNPQKNELWMLDVESEAGGKYTKLTTRVAIVKDVADGLAKEHSEVMAKVRELTTQLSQQTD